MAGGEVLPVEEAHGVEVGFEEVHCAIGQEGDAILGAFAVAHMDLVVIKMDVFDAQAHGFHEAQARAVE